MYHYTESGLQNVWLLNGYKMRKTPYGAGVSIQDVEGLHKVIGRALAMRPHLTGAQLRFLRKEMGLSQAALCKLLGTSEQNLSLWERRGRMPRVADRLVKLIYLEQIGGNVKIREMIEALSEIDSQPEEKMNFHECHGDWKEAA